MHEAVTNSMRYEKDLGRARPEIPVEIDYNRPNYLREAPYSTCSPSI